MNGDPQKRKVLYEALTKDGYALGTLDEFSSKMDDPNKAKALYDGITKDGYQVGDFETFNAKVGSPKPAALSSMTTPLPGAAAGPSTGSGMQQGVPQTPSPAQQPPSVQDTQQVAGLPESVEPIRLDEAGDQIVDMPAEFLTKSRQREAWRTVTSAPDKPARDAAMAQIKADRAVRSKMDRVFAQKQEDRRLVDEQVSRDLQFSLPPQEVPSGLPEGQGPTTSMLDPREQKVRADYMNSLTPEQQAYRASKQDAGQWVDRDAFDEDVSSLTHAMNVLDARERRLLRKSEFRKAQQQTDAAGDVLFQDNSDVMAEAQDIDLGKQYVIERLQTAVRRHPEYASEELVRKAKTFQADVGAIVNPAAYSVAQPILFAIDKFAASILTTPRSFGGAEYGKTDQLAEWAERSMENIRANEPTKFRGSIIEEGGAVNPERILPKVVETIAQAALLMGTSPTRPALLASSFVQTNGDYYKEATTRGLTHDQAKAFAWSAAALTSALEMASPNDAARQMVAGTLRKEIAAGLEQGLTTKEILKRASAAAGKEVLPEAGQEGGQYLGDKGAAYLTNRILGSDNLDDEVKFTEFTENSLLGGVVGGLSGGGTEAMRLASIQETAANPQKVAEAAKAMGDEKAAEKVQRIVNTYEANGLPKVAPEKAAMAADAIIRKDDLKERIAQAPMDPAIEAVSGDPRRSEEIALTAKAMIAMGIEPSKAAMALAGQGMLNIPEGAKVKKMADGTVDIEVKEPKEGEEGVSKKEVQADLAKQVESILKATFTEEATGVDEEPTAAPTGVPEGGVPVSTEAAIPAAPSTSPVPDGFVRRFHVTGLENADGIRANGISMSKAKGVEGPKAIYGWPTYEEAKNYAGGSDAAIVEYLVPKEQADRNPVSSVGDIAPDKIMAVHEPWHAHYRYAKEEGVSPNEMRGIDEQYDKAANALEAELTNEGSTTTTEAPAAQAPEDTGDPAGVPPAPEPAAAEPIAIAAETATPKATLEKMDPTARDLAERKDKLGQQKLVKDLTGIQEVLGKVLDLTADIPTVTNGPLDPVAINKKLAKYGASAAFGDTQFQLTVRMPNGGSASFNVLALPNILAEVKKVSKPMSEAPIGGPKKRTMGNFDTVDTAKESLAMAESNLENAKREDNKKLIALFQDQYDKVKKLHDQKVAAEEARVRYEAELAKNELDTATFEAKSREEKERRKFETQQTNYEFEERQKELSKNLTEEDRMDGVYRDKTQFGDKLTPEELAYVNENYFRPEGYDFDENGGLVQAAAQQTSIGQAPSEQKPSDRKPVKTGKLRTDRVIAALREIAPNLTVSSPKTSKAYAIELERIGLDGISSSWGVYDPNTNSIFLNPESPDLKQTLMHETAHPLITALAKNNPELFAKFHEDVMAHPDAQKYRDHAAKYKDKSEVMQAAEALAEFLGDAGAGRIKFSKDPESLWQKMVAWFKDVMAALGWDTRSIDLSNAQDVQQFAAGFAKAVKKGIKITGFTPVDADPAVQLQDDADRLVNGWYSRLDQAVASKGNTQSGADWMKWAEARAKEGALSMEEVKWTGLSDFLQGKAKVTPKEVRDFLKENRVKVEVVEKGGGTKYTADQISKTVENENGWIFYFGDVTGDTWTSQSVSNSRAFTEEEAVGIAVDEMNADNDGAPSGKFSQYQLPGGENYREVLVTLPKRGASQAELEVQAQEQYGKPYTELNDAQQSNTLSYVREARKDPEFRSSHFDDPNILVHLRLNDRVDSDGRRVLFIEELQSDFAQTGKKKGFQPLDKAEQQRTYNKYIADGMAPIEAMHRIEEETGSGPIPRAPFVTDTNSWVELGMKQAIRMAVEGGYDKIAWTNGEQQNERYDLSKQVDEIRWSKGKSPFSGNDVTFVEIYPKDTSEQESYELAVNKDGVVEDGEMEEAKGKPLEDIVGKDVARNILNAANGVRRVEVKPLTDPERQQYGFLKSLRDEKKPLSPSDSRNLNAYEERLKALATGKDGYIDVPASPESHGVISGDGLKVGGSGMKGFYDKILPTVAKKVSKKLGGDGVLGEVQMKAPGRKVSAGSLIDDTTRRHLEGGATLSQQSIEITPDMRRKVDTGVPLMQKPAETKQAPANKAEAAARKAAAALEKAKLKGDQLYALPLPPGVWNGAIRAMQEVIIAGGKAADAIAAAIKHIQNSDWWKNKATQKEKDEVIASVQSRQSELAKSLGEEEPAPKAEEPPPAAPKAAKEPSEPKEVKKTFTTVRAYEGDFREEVKAELAKGGLYRDIENQEEAEERADAFIAKVGIDAALQAARTGDVRGGARSVIVVRALEDLDRQYMKAKTPERMAEVLAETAELIQWRDRTFTEIGRETSMMARMYEKSDLGFTVAARTSDWKKKTGEEPTEDQIKRWKEVEAEMNVWKEKYAEAEKRAEEAQAAATLKAIQDSVTRQKAANRKTTPAQKSKVLADKIRTLKISQPGALRSTTMVPELWNASVEVVAQTVQAGGNLATAIQIGLNKIRESEWYKKLKQKEQEEAETSFSSTIEDAMADDVEVGPLRIPKQMIRDAVEAGAKDIDSLVAVIKGQIKEEYPDATDRQIRDAITEYGKVVNLNKDELSVEVRRIKRIGRIVSALEDVANKIRPLRSGLQRDKLDAEERALNKELREALKDLPVDAEAQARELRTALDAAKTRARNRIEDLQREIDTKQRTPRSTTRVEPDAELEALIAEKEELEKEHDAIFGDKSLTAEERLKRAIDSTRRSVEALDQKIRDKNVDPAKPATVPETPELKALRERRAKLREEYRKMQEEAGVIDRRRLDTAKKVAKARIQELERRIDQGDFSKKEAKPPVLDNELIQLQAEKMRLKEEYDKELYKHKLLNRTMPERVKDSLWEFWGLTRALRATGELSFVLIQGGSLTISNMWHKPGAVGRAFKAMWQAMRSEKKSEEWLRKVKSQTWYPIAKEAKLAITEPHAELSAREELFMSDWLKIIWNVLGSPLKPISKKAYEAWTKANPARVIERGASAYLDTLRIERFMDGMAMLEKNTGNSPSKEELKDIADVANTLTGRASIGKLEPIASTLTKLFFSPRLWASAIKTGTPYAFIHFGKMTPTARKMAMQDLGRYIGTTMGLVAMAAAYLNNDDDDETGVETDPRSADFGKIKIGNKYIDPWGGRIQQLVFSTRMTIGALSLIGEGLGKEPLPAYKDRKTGDITPLGQGMTPTMAETAIRMAQNKLAPSAGLLWEAASTKVRKDGTRTSFGKEYDMSEELAGNLYPIYVETVADLAKEDPGALEGFLMFYAFFGGGVNVNAPEEPKERVRPARPERPERPTR